MQNDGFVWFKFTDNSLCEEGFTLHREHRGKKTVLAPNYYYLTDNACGDLLQPGKDFADDLSRSNLAVGELYEYCVAASALNYMAQPSTKENLNPPFKRQSASECLPYSIQWVRVGR